MVRNRELFSLIQLERGGRKGRERGEKGDALGERGGEESGSEEGDMAGVLREAIKAPFSLGIVGAASSAAIGLH